MTVVLPVVSRQAIPQHKALLNNVSSKMQDQQRNPNGRTVRSAGIVTYFEIKEQHILPNAEYTFDLPLPPRDSSDYVLPKPNDDEVDSFELLPVQRLTEALRDGEFKPSSAIVTIDFLRTHGFVSPENEPNYEVVVGRCHRRCGVSGPGM
ncbi:hypothetical protein I312_105296 [Cryptococcus bacillisporus CA1280]|uniref:uncharacterized protein n=1 Tax=Cryptococcus bacillisporus CA1280 TaxID=1296109 RepID=UPI0033690FD9